MKCRAIRSNNFEPRLLCIGSDLVHNIEIFFIFSCLCGWYSLFPIKDRSTDKHLCENHHNICWKIDFRRSWSMLVKGESPTTIRWWKYPKFFLIQLMNTPESGSGWRERGAREREKQKDKKEKIGKRDLRENEWNEREETSLSEGKKNE